ncbi:MAG: hypothetical protein JXK08_08240 [Flavobacteriaceae bacterium]|nr:hypothetical protein [Flavobacteriaceae bacterium]
MKKYLIVILALVIFSVIGLAYSVFLKSYVKTTFGEKWLHLWNNKLYFWQSTIFVSAAFTFLIMYILKWIEVLDF